MPLNKPYLDVPGTTIFDADQSRKGYWLNQFCMSLMRADNRARFLADEPGDAPEVARRFYHVPASNTAVGHLVLEA